MAEPAAVPQRLSGKAVSTAWGYDTGDHVEVFRHQTERQWPSLHY